MIQFSGYIWWYIVNIACLLSSSKKICWNGDSGTTVHISKKSFCWHQNTASHTAYQLCHRVTKSQTFALPNYWKEISTIFTCPWHTELLTPIIWTSIVLLLLLNFPSIPLKTQHFYPKWLTISAFNNEGTNTEQQESCVTRWTRIILLELLKWQRHSQLQGGRPESILHYYVTVTN